MNRTLSATAAMPGISLQRVEDLRQAIDPDLVVEAAPAPGTTILRCHSSTRLAGSSITSRRPRMQRVPRAFSISRVERTSPRRPKRLLVDQEHVRLEHLGSVVDDRAADLERLLDVEMQVQRGVLAVAQLDHAGHADEVDPRAEIEAADDRRAREDQHREVLESLDQMTARSPGNGADAPDQSCRGCRSAAGCRDPSRFDPD